MSTDQDSRAITQLIGQVDILTGIVSFIAVLLLVKASVTVIHIFSLYYKAAQPKEGLKSVVVKNEKKKTSKKPEHASKLSNTSKLSRGASTTRDSISQTSATKKNGLRFKKEEMSKTDHQLPRYKMNPFK